MSDLISREAAITDVCDCTCGELKDSCTFQKDCSYWMSLMNIPAVQPEIIRCADCKYYDDSTDESYCEVLYDGDGYWMTPEPDDFCSYAERRNDG